MCNKTSHAAVRRLAQDLLAADSRGKEAGATREQRMEAFLNQAAACPWCSEPSAASRGRTRDDRAFAAGRGERRVKLLDLISSAPWAFGRFRAAAQDELLEDVAAIGAGVFKHRHGTVHSLCAAPQLPCADFPSGEAERGFQSNRDLPGMLGSTMNQTTKNRRQTTSPAIA